MRKTTLTPQDFQRLNLLATHASINAPHKARFHNFAANLEDLFPAPVGHVDQRYDYRSALSPSAYLVDLVRLVSGHIIPPADNRFALPQRRPDIFELELSQKKAEQSVPYLDIANHVMRRYLSHTVGPDGAVGFNITATSITRNDGGNWVTDAYRIGDYIRISAAADSQNNRQFGPITQVDDKVNGAITIASGGFTANGADKQASVSGIDALELLASARFPLSLPFHRPLTEIRSYLQHFHIDLADIYAAFGVNREGPAWTAEILNLAPGELTYLATPQPAAPELNNAFGLTKIGAVSLGGLDKVAVFLAQTELTQAQLESLVKVAVPEPGLRLNPAASLVKGSGQAQVGDDPQTLRLAPDAPAQDFIGAQIMITDGNAAGQVRAIIDYDSITKIAALDAVLSILPDPSTPYPYAISWQPIEGLSFNNLDYLNRFMRLARRLGWSFDDLNWALHTSGATLLKSLAENTADLNQLAKIAYLQRKYNLPVSELCGLWSDLRTSPPLDPSGGAAVFEQIFSPSLPYLLGMAQAEINASNQTLQLAETAPANADYSHMQVWLTAGTGAGQTRAIAAFNSSTRVATLKTAWETPPDATTQYLILPIYLMGMAEPDADNWQTRLSAATPTHTIAAGMQLWITAGTGAGQTNTISDYNDAANIAISQSMWTTLPDATSQYAVGYAGTPPQKMRAALLGALNISDADAAAVIDHLYRLTGGSLMLDPVTLTRLYRLSRLPRVLGISVTEFLALLTLLQTTGTEPTSPFTPVLAAAEVRTIEDVLTLANWVEWMTATGLNAFQLQYLQAAASPLPTERIFALTAQSLHCSDDRGATWLPVAGLPQTPITGLTAAAADCLIVTTGDGYAVSRNGGAHWTPLAGKIGDQPITKIVAGRRNQAMLFALTAQGFYVSEDDGSHWNLNTDYLTSGSQLVVKEFAYIDSGAYLYAETAQPDQNTVFFYPQVMGEGMKMVSNDGINLTGIIGSDNSLIVPTNVHNFHVSNPTVTKWGVVGGDIEQAPIEQLVVSSDSLLARTASGLYTAIGAISAEKFAGLQGYMGDPFKLTWAAATGAIARKSIQNIAVSGSTLVAATSDQELYFSDDSGARWQPLPLPPNGEVTQVAVVRWSTLQPQPSPAARAVSQTLTPAATTIAIGNYLKQTQAAAFKPAAFAHSGVDADLAAAVAQRLTGLLLDGDGLVIQAHAALTPDAVQVWMDDRFFAVASQGLYVSNDQGASWAAATLSDAPNVTQVTASDNFLVATAGSGFHISQNDGLDWAALPGEIGQTPIRQVVASGQRLFAAAGAGLYASSDSGTSWTLVSEVAKNFSDQEIAQIGASGAHLFAAAAGSLCLSHDGGTRWMPVTGEIAQQSITQVMADGPRLFAVSAEQGLWSSTENETGWAQVTGLPSQQVMQLAAGGGRLWAATADQGLWSSAENETGWAQVTSLPSENIFQVAVADNHLAAATSAGLYLSQDGGAQWAAVGGELAQQTVSHIAASGHLKSSLLQRFTQPNAAAEVQRTQYQDYLQAVAQTLQDTLNQQTQSSAAFWSRVFGSDTLLVAAALHHVAGQQPVTPLLTRNSRVAVGTAQAGSAQSITLAADAAKDAQAYPGRSILITAGTGIGQVRSITQYDAQSRVATVDAPWQPIPDAKSGYAIVDRGLVNQFALLLYLANALALSAPQFHLILEHSQTLGFDLSGAARGIPLAALRQIASFDLLTQVFAQGGDAAGTAKYVNSKKADRAANSAAGLLKYLETTGSSATLALLSGWDAHQIAALANDLPGMNRAAIDGLMVLQRCFELAARLGVHIQLLLDLYNLHAAAETAAGSWAEYQSTAQAFLGVLRSKYTPADWSKTFAPIHDQLNEQERDALTAFLLRQLQNQFSDMRTQQDLYEFLLVDVQMDGCARTSNVREAIDCLQIYIQRCRMQLEKGASLSTQIADETWDWMGHFRLWQANRQLFFYPENYLDPTLRTQTATPEFQALQGELLQGQITPAAVEQAYINYFDRLDQLANLQIVNGCYTMRANPTNGNIEDSLFLIGRTATQPPIYYQRRANLERPGIVGNAVFADADTIHFTPDAPAEDNAYTGKQIMITAGPGTGQARTIRAYGGAGRVATVDAPWQILPDATSQYKIYEALTGKINSWSPWQKIEVNISAEQVLPLYADNRLYIFWVEQKTITDRNSNTTPKEQHTLATIQFSYQQVSGKWMQPQALARDVDLANLPQSYAVPPDGSTTPGSYLFMAQQSASATSPAQAVLSLVAPAWNSSLNLLVNDLLPKAPGATAIGGVTLPVSHSPQWAPVSGLPAPGYWQAVNIDDHFFAVTGKGFYLRDDAEETWSPVSSLSAATNVFQVAAIGGRLFALDFGNQNPSPVGGIYTVDQGLFFSDPATAWVHVTGLNARHIPQILDSGDHLLIPSLDGLFFIDRATLFKNLAAQWTHASGLPATAINQVYSSGGYLFAATNTNGVYILDQNVLFSAPATAWSHVDGLPAKQISQVVFIDGRLFAATADAGLYCIDQDLFFKSPGAAWSQAGGLESFLHHVAAIGDRLYASTWGNGVFSIDRDLFFSNPHAAWSPAQGTENAPISQVVLIGDQLFAGVWESGTGLYQTDFPVIALIAAAGDIWLALPIRQAGAPQTYRFHRATTHCVDALRQTLVQSGLDALLSLPSQTLPEKPFGLLSTSPRVAKPYPSDQLNFDPSGAYALYFSEIFFHIPYLIGDTLQAHQRFAEAKHWYEHIFNPLAPAGQPGAPSGDRFWQYQLFRTQAMADLNAAIQLPAEYLGYEGDPFDPFAIAEVRPGAYQKALAMQYIDNLVAWGDSLYALDGWENLNAATTLYVLAAELLGPRPQPGQAFGQSITGLTPQNMAEILSNFAQGDAVNPFFDVPGSFFVPENDQFAGYWNTVTQRLYQIRHCMNLQGMVRQLATFDPAIDPRQLLRALAGGRSISAVSAGAAVNVPYYRFMVLLERARQVTGELKQLGGDLLSALEKQDGEQLAILRNTYEGAILALTTLIKQKQQEETQHSLDGLQQTLAAAQARVSRYQGWATQYLSPGEQSGLSLTQTGATLKEAASVITTLSAIGYALPNIFGLADGGMNFGKLVEVGADVLNLNASLQDWAGQLALSRAQFDRRQADWQLQADLANYDVQQINAQIAALQTRQVMMDQELAIHQQSIAQNQGIDQYYRQKFTSQELYQWMVSQVGTLYFQTYQLALDLARMAERAFQYECNTDATFLNVNGWDDLHKGLLAGEALALNLNLMEKAYLEQNARQLEIEKTISLLQLNPGALIDLKRSGRCTFEFNEALFDLDFPGHYLRKIKSISISIPAVVGPYQNLHATLIQQNNKVVLTPDLGTVRYLLAEKVPPPDSSKLRVNWQANQQIALSRGVSDAGLFELNFNDERYLPFEGTGAVSAWELRLPKAGNAIAFDSISDVILTLHYTASDGGDAFRRQLLNKSSGAQSLQTLHGYRLFSARQLNPSGWQTWKNSTSPTGLGLKIDATFFPPNLSGSILPDLPATLYAWPEQNDDAPQFTLTPPRAEVTPVEPTFMVDLADVPTALLGTWKVTLPAEVEPQTALKTIEDLLLVVPFQAALNWDAWLSGA